jgi:hypothetical protein
VASKVVNIASGVPAAMLAASNSVNGVMLAVTDDPPEATIECSTVVPLVTRSTQGSTPPLTPALNVPLVDVVALPVPVAHFTSTAPPAMAAPVAAVPTTVRTAGAGGGGDADPPSPPQAARANNEASDSEHQV